MQAQCGAHFVPSIPSRHPAVHRAPLRICVLYLGVPGVPGVRREGGRSTQSVFLECLGRTRSGSRVGVPGCVARRRVGDLEPRTLQHARRPCTRGSPGRQGRKPAGQRAQRAVSAGTPWQGAIAVFQTRLAHHAGQMQAPGTERPPLASWRAGAPAPLAGEASPLGLVPCGGGGLCLGSPWSQIPPQFPHGPVASGPVGESWQPASLPRRTPYLPSQTRACRTLRADKIPSELRAARSRVKHRRPTGAWHALASPQGALIRSLARGIFPSAHAGHRLTSVSPCLGRNGGVRHAECIRGQRGSNPPGPGPGQAGFEAERPHVAAAADGRWRTPIPRAACPVVGRSARSAYCRRPQRGHSVSWRSWPERAHKWDPSPAARRGRGFARQGSPAWELGWRGYERLWAPGRACGVSRTGASGEEHRERGRGVLQSVLWCSACSACSGHSTRCLGLGSLGHASLRQDLSGIRVRGLSAWRGVSLDWSEMASVLGSWNCRT